MLLIVWEGKRISDLLQKLWGRILSPGRWQVLSPQVCLQCCFVSMFCWQSHTACGLRGILQSRFKKDDVGCSGDLM